MWFQSHRLLRHNASVSDVYCRKRSTECVATRLESRTDSRSGAVDSLNRQQNYHHTIEQTRVALFYLFVLVYIGARLI